MFQTHNGLIYDIELSEENSDENCTLVMYRPNGRATKITHFHSVREVLDFLGEASLIEYKAKVS